MWFDLEGAATYSGQRSYPLVSHTQSRNQPSFSEPVNPPENIKERERRNLGPKFCVLKLLYWNIPADKKLRQMAANKLQETAANSKEKSDTNLPPMRIIKVL